MKDKRPRRLDCWTLAHRATAILFLALLFLGHFDWFPFFKGSAAATRALNVLAFADPLAALEAMLASRQATLSLLIAAGLLIVLYAFLGRAFCSWLCPLGLLLELNNELRMRVNRFLRQRKLALPTVHLPRHTKYALLITFLMLSFLLQLPVFQIVSPINALARSVVFGPEAGLVLVGVIVAAEYVAPRAWCRALCPLGALYSVIGRYAPVRVQIDQAREQAGKQCGLCTRSCPMGIEVLAEHIQKGKAAIDDPECTRCGMCIDGCPRASLHLGVGLGLSSVRAAHLLEMDNSMWS
jgi:ferredoxin-type protein NapH